MSHFQYDRPQRSRRVVITGLGAISAAGIGAQALWEALLSARSCVGPITLYKTAGMPVTIGGQVPDFDPARYISSSQKYRRMARHTQFAVVAAQEALADAGLVAKELSERKVAVILGSSTGTSDVAEEATRQMDRSGPRSVSPGVSAAGNMQAAPLAIVDMMGMPNISATCVTNNCSSGIDAVGLAADMIRMGRHDVVITGGADAPLSNVMATVIAAAGMCTRREGSGAGAGRPFDREREGGVLGEGAAVIILEELEAARERGCKIYAEIVSSCSCPDENRESPTAGLEKTMRGAMENGGREPKDIDFVSAWGCGEPVSDRFETDAIKAALGAQAYRVAVGSIKGAIGIPLGAAGALQLVTTSLSHLHNILLPTVNWSHPDLDCDLDYVSNAPRRVRLRNSLLNSHGMSGGNTTLLLSSV